MNVRRLPLPRSLSLLLLAAALWDAWFVYRTSFEVAGRRIFCLFDDAMISMTYARNLVEGYGLNWARQGAPVEGFSHPLWTFLMVPINALPLDLRVRSLGLQLVSLGLLLAHVALVWHLVRRFYATATARFALPAAALTAAFYPLNYWSLMGMETALQALLATGGVFLALETVEEGRDRHLALGGLAALAHGPTAHRYTPNEFQQYLPGHAKWDNDYVLRERRPDVMAQTWGIPPDQVAATLRRHGYRRREGFWVQWPSDKLRPVTLSDPEAQ